jgi:hypothetical protein
MTLWAGGTSTRRIVELPLAFGHDKAWDIVLAATALHNFLPDISQAGSISDMNASSSPKKQKILGRQWRRFALLFVLWNWPSQQFRNK